MNRAPDHDAFHPVTSSDPAWIETVWFPFWIPEQAMTVYPRVVFQPNGGSYRGSVAVWSGANTLHFEGALSGTFETLSDVGDLRALALPGGLHIGTLEAGSRYHLRYAQGECSFDVVFQALAAPHFPTPDDSPGMFAGHLDQHGRVTGSFQLGADSFEVDCGSVRDRSWGPRVVRSDLRLGNAHATGPKGAFFAYIQEDAAGRDAIHGGTLLRDGETSALVAGERTTEWEDGWPAHIRIRATDQLGRELDARGTCRNRRSVVANPELYALLNFVEWREQGASLEGENHDVWSRTAWLAAGRAPLEGGD
jgi:hypothetical protein